jgi:long-chain acyl-CoA synthetase
MDAINPNPGLPPELARAIETTVPRYFWQRVAERGDKIALREKDLGIWRSVTWREYGERAKWSGLALIALGLRRGDVVSVIADNIPEWLYVDMGTMGVGGVTSGIYTTDSAKQIEYLVNDSSTRFFFAENEEQLDKVLAARARCPSLVKIVVFDMEGLRDFRDPMVMSFDDLLELGRALEAGQPRRWEEELARGKPDDLAILIYTSGTTGPPKGAMISHRSILFQIENQVDWLPTLPTDEQLSFLPLCHIGERNLTAFFPLRHGTTINFAESPETVPENIREVAPTIFFAVPRIWEKFYSAVTLQMRDATAFGQFVYRTALAVGYRRADCLIEGRQPPLWLDLAFRLADLLVLANVKRMIGIARCRWAITGAAPISPDLVRWFLALGLTLREVYGQTECVGVATLTPPGEYKPGSIGKAVPHTEVKLSPEGEILIRGPQVFMGYFNKPEKTAETIVEGWLHTGDVGTMDNEGWFRITDRMKDIIITAGGKNITPSEIENQLKFSPYISDAVVIGDKRKYLTCLVMIDHENVAKFAQDHNVPFTNFASLTRAREVQDLIWQEIEKVNANFARVETIKKFRLIDQLLTAEDEELTPTMKLKRKFVNQKYKPLIDSMYQEA